VCSFFVCRANGQGHRDVCIIPVSAHGTNPASAIMSGMKIVTVSPGAGARARNVHVHAPAVRSDFPCKGGCLKQSVGRVGGTQEGHSFMQIQFANALRKYPCALAKWGVRMRWRACALMQVCVCVCARR